MADFAEGFGAAIEGTLAAKTVEPKSGALSTGKDAAAGCANCGAELTGPYCNQCGQKAHVHRTLTAIGHDLIHGVLHLDGKLAHTLPLLAFKPGRLTRRYIEGERAKFVSPMAMFLFGVFAMFAVFQMVGLTTPTDFDLGGQSGALRAESLAKVERLEKQLAEMDPNDPERASRQQHLEIAKGFAEAGSSDTTSEGGQTDELQDTVKIGGQRVSLSSGLTGAEFIDKLVRKWQQNPGLMLYKMQANGYKFSWLLIPLSLPFVWVMFLWRRGFKAYDHAIFVTYSLSFMSLLFITVSLIAVSPITDKGGWAFLVFAIAAPLHLYKHLRYTYGLSRFSTLWRFFFLSFSMLFIVILFANALLLLGAF